MKVKKTENFINRDKENTLSVDRRQFLKLLGGGIVILFSVGEPSTLLLEAQRRFGRDYPTDFNAYLRIGEDGRVSCFTGKIEMGQGVITSLAQMLAEELDVSLESVDMVMGDTDLCPWDMGTFGSMTTRFFGPALRAAAAEARAVLVVRHHHREPELLEALLREREADQAAAVAGHEVDGLGRHLLGGDAEIALVLAILVVDEDHDAAGADVLDRRPDGGERRMDVRPGLLELELAGSRHVESDLPYGP